MLCCLQLSSSKQPGFLLHVMPVPADFGDSDSQNSVGYGRTTKNISRAGEGPGMQVFPASVPEVAPVSMDKAGGSCIVLE